jgi:hypothetical protein
MEFEFYEYDGMVLLETPEATKEHLRHLTASGKERTPWQYERGANHVHPDMCQPDRIRVREECSIAAGFETSLLNAYPERRFVISHIPGYAVSFYQWVPDAPAEDIPPAEEAKGTVWCQSCQRSRAYEPGQEADAEFPKAQWGRCLECGEDLIIQAGEVLRVIGPQSPTTSAA